ncbi:hypothetical protein [Rothia sp. ZJ1223]|uniref:hypothetical protein n=1 Tax=Rothia sp. ZJ1223 TaxID=2811098 RepID=UPI001958B903|nr:hypothetical protein [Rothia sp. ZJ1223]MBM7051074.1 hypothetical protein [Rothia sp. ZJ1223]
MARNFGSRGGAQGYLKQALNIGMKIASQQSRGRSGTFSTLSRVVRLAQSAGLLDGKRRGQSNHNNRRGVHYEQSHQSPYDRPFKDYRGGSGYDACGTHTRGTSSQSASQYAAAQLTRHLPAILRGMKKK